MSHICQRMRIPDYMVLCRDRCVAAQSIAWLAAASDKKTTVMEVHTNTAISSRHAISRRSCCCPHLLLVVSIDVNQQTDLHACFVSTLYATLSSGL